jgi:LPS O-antigen subunit length determinant protein (WzzB/FepE family)
MSTSSILVMCMIIGVVAGGFTFLLFKAIRKEKEK